MHKTLLVAALALAGCAHKEMSVVQTEAVAAQATLEAKSGSTVGGQAVFFTSAGEVKLRLEVTDAPPGKHAVHLHLNGDCSSDDAASAGPHWNPADEPHGRLGHGAAHMGDIGNIDVGNDGRGVLTFSTKEWQAATGTAADVVGHAIIVHATDDDFTSQPAGNAGGRIACGVVKPTGDLPPVVSGSAR